MRKSLCPCVLIALTVCFVTCPLAVAQTLSTWTGASGTNWDDAANWTTSSYPNNGQPGAGDTYDALIDLPGALVNLFVDIEIENLTIDDPSVSFLQSGSLLKCNQGIDINAGTHRINQAVIKDTVFNLNGGQFVLSPGSINELNNVTFNGDLTVDETTFFTNGTIVNGDIDVTGFATILYVFGNSNGYQFDLASGRMIDIYDGRLSLSNNLQFTIKPGATVLGDGRIESLGGDTTLTNEGLILGVSGEFSIVQVATFINNGQMIASNSLFGDLSISPVAFTNLGTMTAEVSRDITLGGDWTNENGIINLDNAASLQLAGEFTTSDIGTINLLTGNAFVSILAGTWDNTGAVSDLSEFGGNGVRLDAGVNPGVIRGGVIDNSAQLLTFQGSSTTSHVCMLDGVKITGGIDMRPAVGTSKSNVRMINGADIDGDVFFDQNDRVSVFGGTIGDTATFELDGTLDLGFGGDFGADGEMDLTIGPNTVIRGTGNIKTDLNAIGDGAIIHQGTLIAGMFSTFLETDYFENQGLIQIDSGASVVVERIDSASSDLRFVQTIGTTVLNGGTLRSIQSANYDFTDLEFPGGRLEGNGLIRGNVIFGGTLAIGQSSGQIDSTDGDFTISPNATLDFEIGGTKQGAIIDGYDFLNVDGTLNLGGQLTISLIDNFGSSIQAQDQFVIMESLGGIVGQFDNVADGGTIFSSDGLFSFTVHYGTGSIFNANHVVVTGATARTPTEAFGNKLLDGVVAAGQLADIGSSDDIYLELAPAPTSNPIKQKIDMILLADTSVANPGSFQFRLEASMTGGPEGDVLQTIELWNEQDGVWDVYDVRPATNTDTGIVVTATGDLSRYVHPLTGEVIAKVKWESPEFSGPPFTWSIELDQAVWFID